MEDPKEQLVDFLDREVFNPVLRATFRGRSEKEKQDLDKAKRATEAEQERYRHYASAQKVKQMFRDDLSSKKAREIDAKLEGLGLPTLPSVKDEFLKLCEKLEVQ